MKAIIYCRVSTKEQTHNLSLSTQQRACEEYCRRLGLEIDRVFIEQGESAKTVDRTEFKKLLEHCRKNSSHIGSLVVYNISRFSGNTADHLVIGHQLRKLGIELRSVTEPIDTSSTGKFMEVVLSAVAQLDNDMRADRTRAGMKAAVVAGRWPFKASLGFLTGSHGAASLRLDSERGPMVLYAFELYATGRHTKRYVLDVVTAMGLRTRAGKKLTLETFSQMLRKPVYAGCVAVKKWGEGEKVIFSRWFYRRFLTRYNES